VRRALLDVLTLRFVLKLFIAVSQDLSPEVCPDIFVVRLCQALKQK
jgi:hypothetical protein